MRAGHVLAWHRLVTAFGHVSQRTGTSMLITPAADLAGVTADALVEVSLDARALPPAAPAEAWAHLAIYTARSDVGAIARAQPPAAFAAAAALCSRQSGLAGGTAAGGAAGTPAVVTLPLLYGQACWLGERVPVHEDARLLRSPELAAAAAATLGAANALLLRGNGALTCGTDPGAAAARMWLLNAACQAWLAAAAAAGPVDELTAAEVGSWRSVQAELLPRLWGHLAGSVTTLSARSSITRTRSSIAQETARG